MFGIFGLVLNWLTAGPLDRILSSIDKHGSDLTDRDRIKSEAVSAYVQAQVSLANSRQWFFPLFMLGAIFGKLMDDSGCARVIAHRIARFTGPDRAILAVVLACGILTYGGVSLFVVAFAVYPIARQLFREAGIPKRLIPACIAAGSFTFTMTALPGTPAIQNAIPAPYFGTNTFAAPGLGLLAGGLMFAGCLGWLHWRSARARGAGEGYGMHAE